MSVRGLKLDPMIGLRNGGKGGCGLPSLSMFQNGHLPTGIIPVSRVIHVKDGHGNDRDLGSDMDTGSDSDDDEVYGAGYSLETSPQDDKVLNGVGLRDSNLFDRHNSSGTAEVHSQFSSSKDEFPPKWGNFLERLGGRAAGNLASGSGSVDEGSLDSGMRAKERSIPFRSNNGYGDYQRKDTSAAYCYRPHLQSNVNASRQDYIGAELHNIKFSEDIPSAPPVAGSVPDINQVAESEPFRADATPCPGISGGSATMDKLNTCKSTPSFAAARRTSDPHIRTASVSSHSLPACFPTYHASELGSWCGIISYDACVRLCLCAWAKGCMEAPFFLENECAVLRNSFGLKHILLQSEEELLTRKSSELISEAAVVKPKKTFSKMKLQVRKVKMVLDPPTGCSFSSIKPPQLKMEVLKCRLTNIKSTLSAEWEAVRKIRVTPPMPSNGSFSRQSLAYMHAGTQYVKEVSKILKVGLTSFRNSPSSLEEVVQETYSCVLRLKSVSEDDAVRMQPGSGETHVFLPDGLGDDLMIEVYDSKGKYHGRVVAQMADIADDPGDKLRWWSIYHEPEHEIVGRIQLYINYSTSADENINLKCGSIAETVAYDFVLETAMKVQQFQQRQLLLHGPWRWLVTEFAKYYGVSDAYTKLRYLTYIMDVATPTADCLDLVHDLLLPVVVTKNKLSHQENRILGEVSEQIEQVIALVFENYKSLDELAPSGMDDVFKPATGLAAPALTPALKLFNLLHDILSSEAKLKLCRYFQTAARKRCRRHLAETDEFVSDNNENTQMDPLALSTAYQKMKSLCLNIRNEIFTDIKIHNLHVLPSCVDLPNHSSAIYSKELCTRMRSFLGACPPTCPSPAVTELIIATADFQRDLASWNINPVKGGIDAKELFHVYITCWIQDKRLALLESCKPDKVKLSSIQTQHPTTPFIDDIYDKLKETLNEYEVVINRWPEYSFPLESAIADVEKAVVETLEKTYADILSPLKENSIPIKLGLKYVQKIAKGTVSAYNVSNELGVLLNSMKRMLDVLRPLIEVKLKAWGSCIADGGDVPGERLCERTVILRAKLRTYSQALTDKLVENTKLQNATKLKKILQDAKEGVLESDLRNKMQPLKDLLVKMINQLHTVFETQLFIIVCRGFWDRMGQDMLRVLEDRTENKSWYKASRLGISVLDDTFASEMQQLLGNSLQEKDLEPPRSIVEVRAMLCKDDVNHKDNNNYFY